MIEITLLYIIVSGLVSFFACMFSAIAWWWAWLILLPILISLNIPYVNALASHKLAVWFIWVWSLMRYYREKIINIKVALVSWILPLPFVYFWTRFSSIIPWEIMKFILWIIIILMVIFTHFFNPNKINWNNKKETNINDLILMTVLLLPVAFFNWWISAWSWFFVTLIYIYVLKYNYLKAVATMIVANGIFWNIGWAIVHVYLWHVIWALAPGLIIWVIAWSYVWAHIVIKKWNNFVKIIFMTTSIIIWIYLILKWMN